jgi:hypothetical protein
LYLISGKIRDRYESSLTNRSKTGVPDDQAATSFRCPNTTFAFGSPAMPQAVSRSYSTDFYVEGCKDYLAGKSSFFGGRYVGAVEVLDALNDGDPAAFRCSRR